MKSLAIAFACCALLFGGNARATILRVPSQIQTIQGALNYLQNEDTVLVELGVYHEALVAPQGISFTMLGDVTIDSINSPRPTVDISSLDTFRVLACLNINSAAVVNIERMAFFNADSIRGGRSPFNPGGIKSNAQVLNIRDCRFDSTYIGLEPGGGKVTLERSYFFGNVYACIAYHAVQHPINLSNCSLSGNGDMLLWIHDSSRVESCNFAGAMVWATGVGLELRNSTFGPSYGIENGLVLDQVRRARVEQCVFEGMSVVGAPLWIHAVAGATDSIIVRQNTFVYNSPADLGACGGLYVTGTGTHAPVIIEGNVFNNCTGGVRGSRALETNIDAVLRQNHFYGPPDTTIPNITIHNITGCDLRDNSFFNTGYAIKYETGQFREIDARFCWWGDPTGPRNDSLNPAGLGDFIVGRILIDPWRIDTTQGSGDSPARAPLPSLCTLSAYPNPFNAEATLTLSVQQPGIYRIDLVDILGRQVRELYAGTVLGERSLHIDANDLSSGIYFARAMSSTMNQQAALTKIVLLK